MRLLASPFGLAINLEVYELSSASSTFCLVILEKKIGASLWEAEYPGQSYLPWEVYGIEGCCA
jgi:hypothetical protein